MPVYEYECIRCRLRFEELVRSSSQEVVCPGCGRKDIRKLISACAFVSKNASGAVTASSSSGCSGCTSHDCSHCGHG